MNPPIATDVKHSPIITYVEHSLYLRVISDLKARFEIVSRYNIFKFAPESSVFHSFVCLKSEHIRYRPKTCRKYGKKVINGK